MPIRRLLFCLLIAIWLVLMAASAPLTRVIGLVPVLGAVLTFYILIAGIVAYSRKQAKMRHAPRGEIFRHGALFLLLSVLPIVWAFIIAAPTPRAEVYFNNLTINGRPTHLILDTGSSFADLGSTGANRLGIKPAILKPGESPLEMKAGAGVWIWSDPLRLTHGNQTFTFALPIATESAELARINYHEGDEGCIGWPEVRDNILVFDPRRRTVRRVDALPAETAGWLKVPVHRDSRLLIDLPLANGQTGTFLIDTGDQDGVSLPPEQWAAWRKAHPQAAVSTDQIYGDYIGSDIVEVAWADTVTLGALTLTQVHVGQAPSAIAPTIRNYAGSLGLDALERLDLVVDAAAGYAYLKPRPASEAADSSTARTYTHYAIGNWSVDDNVRLKDGPISAHFYDRRGLAKLGKDDTNGAIADFTQALQSDPADTNDALTDRGDARREKGDFAGAIADYSRALELNSDNESAYENRGLAKANQGDYAAAIADYSRALELNPASCSAYDIRAQARIIQTDFIGATIDYTHLADLCPDNFWYPYRRGVARQLQGDFKGALDDYDRAVELHPNDSPHSRTYRQLLRLRLGTAPANFADNLATWPEDWNKTIGEYVAGQVSQRGLLAAAGTSESGPDRARRALAAYYIGMLQLQNGDQPAARSSFQEAMTAEDKTTDEYFLSRAELARLTK